MGPWLFFTRRDEPEPSFFDTARQLLAVPGFTRALCAFVVSIGVSNVLSAFIEETLVAAGISGQQTIDLVRPAAARTPAEQRAACWPGADRHAREGSSVSVVCHARVRARGAAQAGAGFQAAIVVGGIVLGGYVDRTKQYKGVTLGCLAASLLLLLPLGDTSASTPVVLGTLIALGAVIGPVQPINAELAVEVRAADPTAACLADAPGSRPGGPYALSWPATRAPPRGQVAYPADENAIEALQQLCGNLFSALLVPVAERAAEFREPLPGGVLPESARTRAEPSASACSALSLRLWPRPAQLGQLQGQFLLLGGLVTGGLAFFSTFDATLRRSALDCAMAPVDSCLQVVGGAPRTSPCALSAECHPPHLVRRWASSRRTRRTCWARSSRCSPTASSSRPSSPPPLPPPPRSWPLPRARSPPSEARRSLAAVAAPPSAERSSVSSHIHRHRPASCLRPRPLPAPSRRCERGGSGVSPARARTPAQYK